MLFNFDSFGSLAEACNHLSDLKDGGKLSEKEWLKGLAAAHDYYGPKYVTKRQAKLVSGDYNPLQQKADGTLVLKEGFKIKKLRTPGTQAGKDSNRVEPQEANLFAILKDGTKVEKFFSPSAIFDPFAPNKLGCEDPIVQATWEGKAIIKAGGQAWLQKRLGDGDSKGDKSVILINLKTMMALTPNETHEVGRKFKGALTPKTSAIVIEEAPKGEKVEHYLVKITLETLFLLPSLEGKEAVVWAEDSKDSTGRIIPNYMREHILSLFPDARVVSYNDLKHLGENHVLYCGTIPNLPMVEKVAAIVSFQVSWDVETMYEKNLDTNGNAHYRKRYDHVNRRPIGLCKENASQIQEAEVFKVIKMVRTNDYLWSTEGRSFERPQIGSHYVEAMVQPIDHCIVDESEDKNIIFRIITQDGKVHIVEREPLPRKLGPKKEDGTQDILKSGERCRAEQLALEFQSGYLDDVIRDLDEESPTFGRVIGQAKEAGLGGAGSINAIEVHWVEEETVKVLVKGKAQKQIVEHPCSIVRTDLVKSAPEDQTEVISRWTKEQPLATDEWISLEVSNRKRQTRREAGKHKLSNPVTNKGSGGDGVWRQRARNSKHGLTFDKVQRAQSWSAFSRN